MVPKPPQEDSIYERHRHCGILDEQRALSHSIAAPMNVAPEISPDDMLFDFLIRAVFPNDHSKAVDAYFTGGQACAQRFAALCREHLQSEPETILNLRPAMAGSPGTPNMFSLRRRGHAAMCTRAPSNSTPGRWPGSVHLPVPAEGWTVERRFDAVFALSFFSHMPDATFAAWLERLFSTVEPGGILVFTTHGAISLRNMKAGGLDANFDGKGYYWNAQSDQRDIDSTDYGTSAVTLGYVQRALQSLPGAELIRFQQAFWWGHQDLYVVRKRPATAS